MAEVKLEVSGSTASHYEVLFVYEDEQLLAFCDCKAGSNGQHCKHRVNILEGDFSSVVGGDRDKLPLIQQWLPGSPLEAALNEVRNAESLATEAKSRLSKAKKALARAMRA